jgi:hypothetical protein
MTATLGIAPDTTASSSAARAPRIREQGWRLHDRVTHIPIYELAFIWGVGPRVEEPGINLIRSFAYSGPLEDVKLKRR